MEQSSSKKIEWKREYATGIVKVDNQHQRLIKIINDLVDAHDLNKDRSEIENIFLGLVNYTNYHFTTEEQVMQDHNYHDYINHKNLHDDFFNKIDEFKLQYHKGNPVALAYTIDYLFDWLIDHILVEDKKYVPDLFEKFT